MLKPLVPALAAASAGSKPPSLQHGQTPQAKGHVSPPASPATPSRGSRPVNQPVGREESQGPKLGLFDLICIGIGPVREGRGREQGVMAAKGLCIAKSQGKMRGGGGGGVGDCRVPKSTGEGTAWQAGLMDRIPDAAQGLCRERGLRPQRRGAKTSGARQA